MTVHLFGDGPERSACSAARLTLLTVGTALLASTLYLIAGLEPAMTQNELFGPLIHLPPLFLL